MALILNIPSGSFSGREPEAYAVMSHLYAMPRLPQQGDRHRLANEILPFANKLFPFDQPDSALFFSAVQGVVTTMQEIPTWYAELAATSERLVDQYTAIKWTLRGMELALGFIVPRACVGRTEGARRFPQGSVRAGRGRATNWRPRKGQSRGGRGKAERYKNGVGWI